MSDIFTIQKGDTTLKITLDLYNNNIVTIKSKQLDNARKLEIHFTENGEEYRMLKNQYTAFIRWRRPDGKSCIAQSHEYTKEDDFPIFKISNQMLAVKGRAIADVIIITAEDLDNINDMTLEEIMDIKYNILSTMKFYVNIDEAATDFDGTINSDEELDMAKNLMAAAKILNELNNTVSTAESERVMAESERTSAESERKNAESQRIRDEYARQAEELKRKDVENVRISNEEGRQELYEKSKKVYDRLADVDTMLNRTFVAKYGETSYEDIIEASLDLTKYVRCDYSGLLEAGLYDVGGKCVATWSDLLKNGLKIGNDADADAVDFSMFVNLNRWGGLGDSFDNGIYLVLPFDVNYIGAGHFKNCTRLKCIVCSESANFNAKSMTGCEADVIKLPYSGNGNTDGTIVNYGGSASLEVNPKYQTSNVFEFSCVASGKELGNYTFVVHLYCHKEDGWSFAFKTNRIIDDTAGRFVTDKTWSADCLDGKFNNVEGTLRTLIDGTNGRVDDIETDLTAMIKNTAASLSTLNESFQKTKTAFDNHIGAANVLWSGCWVMSESHTAELSQPITSQEHGIVLIFSYYDTKNKEPKDQGFHHFFVSKFCVSPKRTSTSDPLWNSGSGHSFQMNTTSFSWFASKYLYIWDKKIVGYANNTAKSGTDDAVLFDNSKFVLRAVIGV